MVLSRAQQQVLVDALGPEYAGAAANYFMADMNSDDEKTCRELQALGLFEAKVNTMATRSSTLLFFHLTPEGTEEALRFK